MTALAEAALDAREREALDRFVARIVDELGDELLAVWLYGSRARGERHDESDIDVLVIVRDASREKRRRVSAISSEVKLAQEGPWVDLMAHVRDPEWLRQRREIESFFIQEVDRDKIVIYGEAL